MLTQDPDTLATIACHPNALFCIGFAAEAECLEGFGETKRQREGILLPVGNLGRQTFDHDDNEVAFFDTKGIIHLPHAGKLVLARQIVMAIADRVHGAQS